MDELTQRPGAIVWVPEKDCGWSVEQLLLRVRRLEEIVARLERAADSADEEPYDFGDCANPPGDSE